jgi:hypothetical protein
MPFFHSITIQFRSESANTGVRILQSIDTANKLSEQLKVADVPTDMRAECVTTLVTRK